MHEKRRTKEFSLCVEDLGSSHRVARKSRPGQLGMILARIFESGVERNVDCE